MLVCKYCDHLPLYRQSEMYARQDVELERSTLADWVGSMSRLLEPLVEALRRYVMAAGKLHADDTPVPVLAPGRARPRPVDCGPTFAMIVPQATPLSGGVVCLLAGSQRRTSRAASGKFRGTLQADAYAGFNQLYENGRIEQAACWAHVRRKFYDLEQAHASPVAREALQRIGALYGIEEQIRGVRQNERRARPPQQAQPLLDSLRQWFEATLSKLSRKSETTVAIRYALSRWDALTRYIEDGHIEIDNNAAERSLRGVALGRKNYLFAGSDAGGERAAALYSLIGSAKLNGLDPEAYLREVLTRIADHPINRIRRISALEYQIHASRSVHLTYSWTLSKTVLSGRLQFYWSCTIASARWLPDPLARFI